MHFAISFEELLHVLLEEKQRIMITGETSERLCFTFLRRVYLLFELCQNIRKI